MNIAPSETREAKYWLRLSADSDLLPSSRLREITNEADEITKIFGSIVKNSSTPVSHK